VAVVEDEFIIRNFHAEIASDVLKSRKCFVDITIFNKIVEECITMMKRPNK